MNVSDLPELEDLIKDLWRRRDVFAASTLHIMGEIESKLDQSGWDEPGRLFFVHRQMADAEQLKRWAEKHPTQLPNGGTDGFTMAVMELPSPEGTPWFDGLDLEGAKFSLTTLAEVIKESADPPVPTLAVVMSAEAWVVVARGQAGEDYDGPEPSQHPDRVEVRMIFAVDAAGVSYFACRVREDGKRHGKVIGPGDAGMIGDEHTDGIRIVMDAITEASGGAPV